MRTLYPLCESGVRGRERDVGGRRDDVEDFWEGGEEGGEELFGVIFGYVKAIEGYYDVVLLQSIQKNIPKNVSRIRII